MDCIQIKKYIFSLFYSFARHRTYFNSDIKSLKQPTIKFKKLNISRTNERNERTKEPTNKRTNEQTNEQTNKQTNDKQTHRKQTNKQQFDDHANKPNKPTNTNLLLL